MKPINLSWLPNLPNRPLDYAICLYGQLLLFVIIVVGLLLLFWLTRDDPGKSLTELTRCAVRIAPVITLWPLAIWILLGPDRPLRIEWFLESHPAQTCCSLLTFRAAIVALRYCAPELARN